jgi:hypothetical protein
MIRVHDDGDEMSEDAYERVVERFKKLREERDMAGLPHYTQPLASKMCYEPVALNLYEVVFYMKGKEEAIVLENVLSVTPRPFNGMTFTPRGMAKISYDANLNDINSIYSWICTLPGMEFERMTANVFNKAGNLYYTINAIDGYIVGKTPYDDDFDRLVDEGETDIVRVEMLIYAREFEEIRA